MRETRASEEWWSDGREDIDEARTATGGCGELESALFNEEDVPVDWR